MQFTPYLQFDGRCETAFKFYQRCFGGNIASMVPYSETPMAAQVPPEWGNKLCHATLVSGDHALMGCDATPERYESPKGIYITFDAKEPADAERVFKALSENGNVIMPLQKTFWASTMTM